MVRFSLVLIVSLCFLLRVDGKDEGTIMGSRDEGSCGDGVNWVLNDGVLTISGNGKMDNFSYSLPWNCQNVLSVVIESGVTSIGNHSFDSCTKMTTVSIPSGVTYIGDFAFFMCKVLSSVSFPDSLEYIGMDTFSSCNAFQTVTIPDKVTHVGNRAFNLCSQLTSVTIGAAVRTIGLDVFYNSVKMQSVQVKSGNLNFKAINNVLFSYNGSILIFYPPSKTDTSYSIPSSVETISEDAFSYGKYLKTVTFLGGVKTIKSGAFQSSVLESITIPNSVTSMEWGAFSSCSNLKQAIIGTGLSAIPPSAFSSCKSLSSLTISSGVTTIGSSAFEGCDKIENVVIPNSVTSIGSRAFMSCKKWRLNVPTNVQQINGSAYYGCSSITSVTIPASTSLIGSDVFTSCSSLQSINVAENNQFYSSLDGVLFDKRRTTLITFPMAKSNTSYTVPNTVATIGRTAFLYCNNLTRVTMTAVEKIDDYGFGYCYRLETIIFPDTLKTVKAYAFFSCLSLINITIPDSLTSIENYAFNYCPNLATIFYQGTEPFTKSSKAFDRCNSPAVCVSPDFESDKFCGESVSSNETCVTFQGLFNKCYKGAYINGDFVQSKRKNATEWENQTTNCVEFVCDNSSGPVTNDKVDCSQPRACHVGHCNESTGDCEFEKIDGWQELSSQENECYEVACDGNGWVVQKRKNATEWEAQRSQCVDYICDNSSGFVKNNKTECNAPPSCHKSDGYCDEESGKCEYSKTEEWYELISKENECYEVACDGNEWIVRKRKNATEWESETNECFEYMCNNDSGRTAISLCNNSAGVERMCIDGKCIEDKKLNDMKWSVEIKFDDEIKPEDVMISELMENIVSISGVDKNTIEIGIEVDDDGNIIRVIVYTNDKDAAMKVSGRASEALKSNKCGYGVLCRAKIGVKPPSQNLLSCCIYEEPTIAIPVMTFLMAMLKMFV